jgi:uncharacterized protein
MMRPLAALIIACMLAACGSSPPTHFFTLTPVAPAGHAAAAPPFPVQVNAVHLPAVLDRNEVVRQTGANTLSISDQDRWGAPLGEMARNVLAQDLAKRMPPGTVIFPQAPAPQSAAHLVVTIAKFGEDPDGRVRLAGSWALMKGNPSKPFLHRDIDLEGHAATGSAAAQAAGMSDLLARLADQIAGEMNAPSMARK